MRRFYKTAGFALIAGLLTCPAMSGQETKSERDAVAKSFKQYIGEYMESYKTDKRQQIYVVTGEGWRKKISEPEPDYKIDVRSTDSLMSPYIGVCEFTMTAHVTGPHETKQEAEKDNSYVLTKSEKHRHTYAFQDEHWVPKSREHYSEFLHEWFKCNTAKKFPPRDVDGCWENHAALQSDDAQDE